MAVTIMYHKAGVPFYEVAGIEMIQYVQELNES